MPGKYQTNIIMKNCKLIFGLAFLYFISLPLRTNSQSSIENFTHIGGNDEEIVLDLHVDADGNRYLLLNSDSDVLFYDGDSISNTPRYILIKMDAAGNLLYSYPFVAASGYLFMHRFEINGNGDIILSGSLNGRLIFGDTIVETNSIKGMLLRFSNDEPDIIKILDYTNDYLLGREFVLDNEDNIYIPAISLANEYFFPGMDTITTNYSGFTIPLLKFSPDFELEWAKVYYSNGSLVGRRAIALDSDNNIVVVNQMEGDTLFFENQSIGFETGDNMLFVKFSPTGELLWANVASGAFDTFHYDMTIGPDDNIYFATRYSNSYDVYYQGEIIAEKNDYGIYGTVILSLEQEGNINWNKQVNIAYLSWQFVIPFEMKFYGDVLYLVGEYSNKVKFDNIYLPLPATGVNTYLVRMNKEDGSFIDAEGFVGRNTMSSYRIAFDFGESDLFHLATHFSQEIFVGDSLIESYGDKDMYIITIHKTPVSVENILCNPINTVFPNPGTNEFTIETLSEKGKIIIYGQSGNILTTKDFSSLKKLTVNTSTFRPGIYFFQVIYESGKLVSGKWIKR